MAWGSRRRAHSHATATGYSSDDRDEMRLADAVAAVSAEGIAAGRVGDVRSRADVRAALDACEAELGPIDVLLNHAGIGSSTHTLALEDAEWDEVLSINLTGIFRVGQEVARRMAERHAGVILNMSSSGAIAAEPGHAHYAASKAGVLALTRAMAQDLAPLGIRVCALCPGDIDTYEWGNVELQRLYHSRIPAGRAGTPRRGRRRLPLPRLGRRPPPQRGRVHRRRRHARVGRRFRGKRCVVTGEGPVAEAVVARLISEGATVARALDELVGVDVLVTAFAAREDRPFLELDDDLGSARWTAT